MAKKAEKAQSKSKTVRTMIGNVLNMGSEQTIRVRVETKRPHPLYKKTIANHKVYMAHVEPGTEVAAGDVVEIVPTRPMSKNKSWKLNKVLEQAA